MYNKATKYLYACNYTKALQFYKREPLDFKEKYSNMGICYRELGNDSLALKCYLKANDPKTPYADGTYSENYPLALNNIGLMLYYARDNESAMQFYNKALTIDPLYYDAIWNYSSALLCSDINSQLGWDMYEYRFKRNNPVGIDRTIPTWDGVSSGTSICVLSEQGLGDKIMFGRYLPLLRAYFSEVNIQCHPSLNCLFPSYNPSPVAHGSVSIPICSLARIFGVIGPHLDYSGVATSFSSPSIGVCWSGSTTHVNNRNRSCPSSYFSSLSKYGKLYSLTPDAKPAKNVTALLPKSWSDTANNILGLDYVVSVDTSIVHLCGSLGVPCIMVQPLKEADFRWGTGSSTPWYPSLQIVENNNNWDEAFASVHKICTNKFLADTANVSS